VVEPRGIEPLTSSLRNRWKLVSDATTAQQALLARCARGVSERIHSRASTPGAALQTPSGGVLSAT
jgi:hypothetical protein